MTKIAFLTVKCYKSINLIITYDVFQLFFYSVYSSALVQADVMTSGKADAVLKASHITRSRYAHQVSACALFILQRKAYAQEKENSDNQCNEEFETWVVNQEKAYPQFKYWSTTLELELLVFELIRSIREGMVFLYFLNVFVVLEFTETTIYVTSACVL